MNPNQSTYPGAVQGEPAAAFVHLGQLVSNIESEAQTARALAGLIHDRFFGTRPPSSDASARDKLIAPRDGYVTELRHSLETSLAAQRELLQDLEGIARELNLTERGGPGPAFLRTGG